MHKSSRTRIIPFALLLAYPLFAAAAEDPVADIDGLAQQWIGLERQNDLLRSNWRSQQSVLEQQLSLLEREREQLASTLAETEQQQDAVEERRLALLEQQTQLEQEQEVVDRTLKAAVIDIQGIHPQLPPPLKASGAPRQRLDFDRTTGARPGRLRPRAHYAAGSGDPKSVAV